MADWHEPVATKLLPAIGRRRVRSGEKLDEAKPRLRLRALRETEPRIVMALLAPPPLRA